MVQLQPKRNTNHDFPIDPGREWRLELVRGAIAMITRVIHPRCIYWEWQGPSLLYLRFDWDKELWLFVRRVGERVGRLTVLRPVRPKEPKGR